MAQLLIAFATALLYIGPLLAGLGWFDWAVVPVFATIFLMFLLMFRSDWPRELSAWTPQAAVSAGAEIVTQSVLVAVCFALGRGIGGVTGVLPPFPVLLPVAVSCASVVVMMRAVRVMPETAAAADN